MNDSANSAEHGDVAKSSAASSCPESSAKLLPAVAYAPFQILIWAVTPLLFLLWCNLGNYQTVVGDLNAIDRGRWLSSLWGLAALAVGFSGLAVVMFIRKKKVGTLVALLSFFPIVAFINYAIWMLPGTIPRAAQWIIGSESIVIQNLTGAMPGILYFGAVICGGRGKSAAAEMGKAFCGLLVAGGIIWVISLLGIDEDWMVWTVIVIISLTILVFTFVVLRLMIVGGSMMLRMTPLAVTLVGLWLGLLLPMVGLWVNSYFPFPYDFQTPWIYAFAAINGVLLSLPLFTNLVARRVVWIAQCALFPFSLYFFVVFMPFLPFSVPGLAMWGGGLLVLIPAFVVVLHAVRMVDGFRRMEGSRMFQWGALTAALAVLPGAVAMKANADRTVLHNALDFVYVASPHKNARFDGEPVALRRTLTHVREFKAGKKLPLISSFYNATVFNGLTLPESKIKQLSKTFLGEEIESKGEGNLWRGRGGGAFGNQRFRVGDPPHTNVKLLPVTASYRPDDDGFVRTTAMLNMQNQEWQQGEFTTSLTLPENAAVSGFWLHIGNERVPGRMTEKKASMWVYQMIRDVTRRDPGILRYTAPGQLELRVFPFAGNEVRTVEIEFLAPVSIDQPVSIGHHEVALNDGSSQSAAGISLATSDNGTSVAIAADAFSKELSSLQRTPFLYFIADWSASSTLSATDLKDALARASVMFPAATYGNVALANFELLPLSEKPLPLDQLEDALASADDALPRRGGFCPGRAMHSLLVNYMADFRSAELGDVIFDHFPVFMIVGAENAIDLNSEELPWLAQWLPDSPSYYVVDSGTKGWRAKGFTQNSAFLVGGFFEPVHIFRHGGLNLVARAKGGSVAHMNGKPSENGRPLQVFDSARRQFMDVPAVRELAEEEPYAQALSLWRRQLMSIADPSASDGASLRELVVKSRDSGILTGATAYIAVESHAQWMMLEEAEKKKLKAGKAFELSEAPSTSSVPEPSTGLLLMIAGALLTMQRRRRP